MMKIKWTRHQRSNSHRSQGKSSNNQYQLVRSNLTEGTNSLQSQLLLTGVVLVLVVWWGVDARAAPQTQMSHRTGSRQISPKTWSALMEEARSSLTRT